MSMNWVKDPKSQYKRKNKEKKSTNTRRSELNSKIKWFFVKNRGNRPKNWFFDNKLVVFIQRIPYVLCLLFILAMYLYPLVTFIFVNNNDGKSQWECFVMLGISVAYYIIALICFFNIFLVPKNKKEKKNNDSNFDLSSIFFYTCVCFILNGVISFAQFQFCNAGIISHINTKLTEDPNFKLLGRADGIDVDDHFTELRDYFKL
ncbi:hypothetical protein EDEG_00489 [Edhazardia aedis USNM 41457]|uniref:Palmitoyltransferase n=1 Tax=Edhazardia aedis (strain USNM 41457) TaxID=1003232 RepID=J9D172_EDHAE|nr:hypothetical protein EDEG_00489 [Edhazardia aedis USNM 41457]|eukprot:EJW01329.2 hypothetical protein EDEG_00489 [Edhazardia aedis USNM 41457]